ncbi:MAG: hypothetical protein SGILL_006292, partial [Bacillariaceae sp.]
LDFVKIFDIKTLNVPVPVNGNGGLQILKLQKDKINDSFVQSLLENGLITEATLPGDYKIRREQVSEDFAGLHGNKTLMSVSNSNYDSMEQLPFSFDAMSLNKRLSHVTKGILIDFADNEGYRKECLRRVRKEDKYSYVKAQGRFLGFYKGTLAEIVNIGLHQLGVYLFKFLDYFGGQCTDHQDVSSRDDYFMVKDGGHFVVKRTQSVYNNYFLRLDASTGAIGISPNDVFVENINNPYFHNGGGDDAITYMFRTVDGSLMTDEQKFGIMSFLCQLEDALAFMWSDPRSLSDLRQQLDKKRLDPWAIDFLQHYMEHFFFMCDAIAKKGPEFVKQRRMVLNRTLLFSPIRGRKVNVGYFLKRNEYLLFSQGKAAFTEKQLAALRNIGITEKDIRHRPNILSHYYRVLQYMIEGGDVNALQSTDTLEEDKETGKMVVAYKKSESDGTGLGDGAWLKHNITRVRKGQVLSLKQTKLLDNLGVDWGRKFEDQRGDVEENDHFQLLRALCWRMARMLSR